MGVREREEGEQIEKVPANCMKMAYWQRTDTASTCIERRGHFSGRPGPLRGYHIKFIYLTDPAHDIDGHFTKSSVTDDWSVAYVWTHCLPLSYVSNQSLDKYQSANVL